jgi:integrase
MRCKTETQQPELKVFFAGFSMDFMVDFPGHSRKSMVQTPPKKTSFFSHVLAWTFDAPNLPFAHSQDGYHGHARSVGNPTTAREIPLLRPREPRASFKTEEEDGCERASSSSTNAETTGTTGMLMKTGADLLNPESIKEKVAKQERWGENTRRMATAVYKSFAAFNGIPFTPPRYKINQKLPFIPTEGEIDALIVSSPKRLASALQLLKEIPIRIGEALALRWTDIDIECNAIRVNNTEKNGKPRAFKISAKLLSMLNALPKKNEKVFGKAIYCSMENQFTTTRRRTANKLQNPRLMQIHFHTLRHWKATMEYHKTRDILHVMNLLGHRNIESTLVYTQLISFESDEFHSAVAKTVDEARKLLEDGFDYVCQKDDIMLFRKRK